MFKAFTDPDGTLLVNEDPIDSSFEYNGGFAYAPNGAIAISVTTPGTRFIAGFSATDEGRLVIEPDGVIAGYVQGFPVTGVGRLVTRALAPAPNASFVGGVAVNPNGVVIRPVAPNAFSSAFNQGFA